MRTESGILHFIDSVFWHKLSLLLSVVSDSISQNSKQLFHDKIPGSCSKNALMDACTACARKQERGRGHTLLSTRFKS